MRNALGAVLTLVAALGVGGCIDDTDCGICDPENLVLESISALNYAFEPVRLLDPECEGERCPGTFTSGTYFIETIGPCEETEEAEMSSRPGEYCKLAPLVSGFGIEFVFNNLLDAKSIELVRKRPDNPNLFEVYDWKTQILELQGPITRYNGDYVEGGSREPDRVTRLVNLACRDNMEDLGLDFGHETFEDPANNPCNTVGVLDDDIGPQPLKMRAEGTITATRGLWENRAIAAAQGQSCDNPESGADTCCNQCDLILSTQVAKYGLSTRPAGDASMMTWNEVSDLIARPGAGAIECDATAGDKLLECRDFIPWTDRHDETRQYSYEWCPPGGGQCESDHRLPRYDNLRTNHPDDRPPDIEQKTMRCASTAECNEGSDFTSLECVGSNGSGEACSPEAGDPECTEGRCVVAWFVTCDADEDTTGAQGYCVDRRYSDVGAPACFRAPGGFDVVDPETGRCQSARDDTKLAVCDLNEDNRYDAAECCRPELQGQGGSCGDALEACEPSLQPGLRPVSRYERNDILPIPTRECTCDRSFISGRDYVGPAECEEVFKIGCVDEDGDLRRSREGEYAVKFVARRGGVIYDPAIKGFQWRPADLGSVPRAAIESCAGDRGLIPPRIPADGWRANDSIGAAAENYEDYDRGMCSGQTYTVVFQTPPESGDDAREYVRDKIGNALDGKSVYRFETPQFHVVPGSGFPTDNLRIGACDKFEISFSNKYDLSPENLAKVRLFEIDEAGNFVSPRPGCPVGPVAGGVGCAASKAELDASDDACLQPCLTVDVGGQRAGSLRVEIDPAEFGRVLETGRRYSLDVPGLESPDEISEPEKYAAAFWDVCGMPLIRGGYEGDEPDYLYEFLVDEPKCKEDQDRDLVQFSCDNAADVFNPDQGDMDSDGIGDVVDLCPTIVTGVNNSADSDTDGVGNECDNCRRALQQYNRDAVDLGVPAYLQVRNIPNQQDTDRDGIGDVCDNCVVTANCEGYGADDPFVIGDPIAFDDPSKCQRDDDPDMVGDACEGDQAELAAGPVGFGDRDDFDQDGLANVVDACPRQPVPTRIECTTDDECGEGRTCERVTPDDESGICNHLDSDADAVGDICDSCPFVSNPLQIVEGSMQEDDEDGDFVGRDCETAPSCEIRKDPRPKAFYEVSVDGLCCITRLVESPEGLVDSITGQLLVDPDEVPIALGCTEDANGDGQPDGICRALPGTVQAAPGIVELPPGCEEALAAAGYADGTENPRVTPQTTGGDLAQVWDSLCFLPQFDQDFDGIGDPCDLCKFDFDPENLQYIDDNGRLWPNDGRFCNGVYSIDARGCGEEMGGTDTDTDTDAPATSDGGGSSGG